MSESLAEHPSNESIDPANDEVWVTEDGRYIPVCLLTPDHMRNIIRMIQRRHRLELEHAVAEANQELGDEH